MKKSKSYMTYFIFLLLLGFSGCSDNTSKDLLSSSGESSSENLIADAGPDMTIDLPYTFVFENPACDAVNVEWDFNDGKKAQGFKVEHEFKAAGRYIVKVTLTAPGGQTATDTAVVTVYPKDADKDLLEDVIDNDPQNGNINTPRDSKIFYLSTFDDEQLECQLFLPAGEPPYPAVMFGHGWASDMNELAGRAKSFRDKGYATFVWSARGWGNSTGLVRLDSTQYEVKDVIMLINWLAAQKFVIEETRPEWFFENGKIINYNFNQDKYGLEEIDDIPGDESRDFVLGMNGCSYGGSIQMLTASYDRRIDAISPERTWNNLNDALCPKDSMKIIWCGGFYLMGILRVFEGGGVDPLLTDFIVTLLTTNKFKEEMKDQLLLRTPATRIEKVLAPALIIQGEHDTVFDLNQAVANLEQIQANGVEAKMYWYSGGHGYFPENPENIEGMVLAWMDKHLRGRDVGFIPEFRYDVITEDWKPGDKQDVRAGVWPMVAKDEQALFILHSGVSGRKLKCSNNAGSVVACSVNNDESQAFSKMKNIPFVKSSFSEIQGLQGMLKDVYPPFDSTQTSVTFESDEFIEDTEITGIPRLKIMLSSSVPDITFFFKLYDAPSSAASVQGGNNEKVNSDARVINCHVTPLRIYNSSKNSPEMYEIDLRAISYIIKKGHRIRLTIATSDFFFLHSRKLGEGFVWYDAVYPSVLYLPVVGK
jgi:ABC-2 type transport system ATP-binding protein